MSSFTAIDLSKLPAPDIVETLDFETIIAAMKADLVARDPDFAALLDSDPAIKVLQVAAYRELLIRARVNDAARAVMLAHAVGGDLDNLGALFNVARLVIDPGDPNAIPSVPATLEDDERFRGRIQIALESASTAGPVGSYVFHTLSASAEVKDADVASPSPGDVIVTVLSTMGDGTPDQALLDTVTAALTDDEVRPLTDNVTVQAATVVNYTVDATLDVFPGPSANVVRQASEDAITQYCADQHRLGRDITLSGVFAALHQPGVQKVNLTAPAADIVNDGSKAPFCTAITVTLGAVDE